MKKIKLLLILILAFFSMGKIVNATTYRAIIKDDGVHVRSGAGTQYSHLDYIQQGQSFNLVTPNTIKDANNHKNCNSDWYQIYYNGIAPGYVCGDHVEVLESASSDSETAKTSCEQEMANLGFPATYWGGLCRLKQKYPNWQFVALKPSLSWTEIIQRESACGWNLISNTTANKEFIDPSCNKYGNTNVGILPKGIAYYMDPRNYLADSSIFQFLYLDYNQALKEKYLLGVTNTIKNAQFYIYHENQNASRSSQIHIDASINNVGSEMNLNSIFIASRIKQELGNKDTLKDFYQGVYPGYESLYNFYNIGVSDSCVRDYGRSYCGLEYAKKKGWNTVEKAISGGIEFLKTSYFDNNQFSVYFQKFNTYQANADKVASHQYMTNIEAPLSEAEIIYDAFRDANLLNESLTFKIPVYSNMDAPIDNSYNGAIPDENAQSNLSTSTIPTIITSAGYHYSTGFISNIAVGTDANTLKGAIESVAGNGSVTITNAKGDSVTDTDLATGYKVIIKNASTSETLEVVIKGDTSGDGVINALDLLQVQKSILGTYNLEGCYEKAGDTSGDNDINALDLLQVQKNILGTYKIVQ